MILSTFTGIKVIVCFNSWYTFVKIIHCKSANEKRLFYRYSFNRIEPMTRKFTLFFLTLIPNLNSTNENKNKMQNSKLIRIKDAPVAWNCLNGIVNVFKPAGISVNNIKASLLGNLCKDLNSLQTRPPRERVTIAETNNDRYNVDVSTDWSDHVLAVGERHQISDFRYNTSHLSRLTSGVLRMKQSLLHQYIKQLIFLINFQWLA